MRIGARIVIFVAMMICGWVWAGPVDINQAPDQIRLDLDLVDGSRVIGVPRVASVPIQTPYARMDIPLKQISTMEIGEDHEKVSLGLRNGDNLKGVVNLGPIALDTLFGNMKIGIEIIKRVRVIMSGAVREGRLLYFSFDSDTGDRVVDASGNGRDGIMRGSRY